MNLDITRLFITAGFWKNWTNGTLKLNNSSLWTEFMINMCSFIDIFEQNISGVCQV